MEFVKEKNSEKKRVLKHTRVVNQGLMVRRARNNLKALKNLMIKREEKKTN